MFSDEVIGLDIANRRELKRVTQGAQGLVNELDSEIISLRKQLAQARADLARERGARIAAEVRLETVLDMEI